jgi:hypothetical protein
VILIDVFSLSLSPFERDKRPKNEIEFGGERRRRRKESIKVHPEQFHTEDGSQ